MGDGLPNILLIVVDCGRSDRWLGPGRTTRTPTVDALCRRGVAIPTTIVETACTTPSFASLLTGVYSTRHGIPLVWGYRLADEVRMLTDCLKVRGYHTYAEASGPLLPEMGLDRGFDRYEYRAPCDYLHTRWGDAFVERLRGDGYRAPWFLMLHVWELHPHRQVLPEFDRPEYGRDAYERAISSLDAQLARVIEAAGDETFIVLTADHGEKTPDEDYLPGTAVPYACQKLGIQPSDDDNLLPYAIARRAGPSALQQIYRWSRPMVGDLSLEQVRAGRNRSLRSRLRDRLKLLLLTPRIYLHDLLVLRSPQRLTRMLKRRGLLDPERSAKRVERMIALGGVGWLLDMTLRMWVNCYRNNLRDGHMVHVYDALLRVPLVLSWPGRLPDGAQLDRMVRQVDIMPTVLDLIGVPIADMGGIDGRSFMPLIRGEPWEPAPAYVSVSGIPRELVLRGVRTETHKYSFGPHNPELPRELYDLRADPAERNNLAAEQPDRCARLEALADSLLPPEGERRGQALDVSADDQARIEQRLRELGYVE